MKEYIERGWLLELYTMGGDESAVQNYHVPVPMILETINAAPAADVVEVRHAKWVSSEQYNGRPECPVCFYVTDEKTNYCPHCGCKMDREE